jgi:RND family efflux transporter MFP subunit
LEQDKIDVSRATPVADSGTTRARPVRRGAPLWLQLVLSLIVIVIALGIAALFNPTVNEMAKRAGVALPLLTGESGEAQAQPQGQRQGGAQQTAQGAGQRQGQGGGAGRGGGFGGARTAVVVAAPVTVGTINNKLTAIGEGVAIHSVTITAPSGGTLMSVDVKPGDQVSAGQKLATLDSGSQQIAFDKAQLAKQDADAALARAQSLAKTNNISSTAVAAAQLASSQAQLALNDAKLALDQRTISTPVAGTVGLIQVSPGNIINAQTVVTTVEDSSEILINFWVPERYSSQMHTGMAVTAASAALPGQTFEGRITAVDNKLDPESRTLQVQATLPNPKGIIRPGMSFTVDMAFPGETFPAVDPLSVQWSNDGAYVWKIVDGKVRKAMVQIVQRNSDGVLVEGDVTQGDSIVTQGVLQLSDGAAVRLLDAGPPAGPEPEGGTQKGPLPPASATVDMAPQGGGGQASAASRDETRASSEDGASRQGVSAAASSDATG